MAVGRLTAYVVWASEVEAATVILVIYFFECD